MRRRSTLLTVLLIGSLALVAWAVATSAAAPRASAETPVWEHVALQQPEYVGSREGCRKCHLREYRSWEKTPHAAALEALPEEDRGKAECVRCHVTGWGEPTGFTSIEETPDLAGVGCEVCHGPGSLYMDRDVMKDHEASVAAGMLVPDEATCRGCHNEESPDFDGFDYEAAKETGLHDIKQ